MTNLKIMASFFLKKKHTGCIKRFKAQGSLLYLFSSECPKLRLLTAEAANKD